MLARTASAQLRRADRMPAAPATTGAQPQSRAGGSSMTRVDEGALAWALADSATEILDPVLRAWLCAKIGAGEHDSAIKDVLTFYANADAELPCELAAPIQAWIHGYAGSDSEPILRNIYGRISVSSHPQAQ